MLPCYMRKKAAVNVVDEPEAVDPGARGQGRTQQTPNVYEDSWQGSFPEHAEENDSPMGADPIAPGRRIEGQLTECPFKVGDKVKSPLGRNGGWMHGFVDEIKHGFELENEDDDVGYEAWLIGVTWQWPLNEIPNLAPRNRRVDPDERGWYSVRADGSGQCYLYHENQMQASDDGTITIQFEGDEKNGLVSMVEYLKRQTGIGHSFEVVVDPDDSEYRRSFGFDGDGAFKIREIKTADEKAHFGDLPLVIEWRAGDIREGENRDGHKWKREMHADYGHIPDTEGADGDGIDVYVGSADSDKVFIVSQLRDGEYDEDKCMLGFSSPEEAEEAYRKHYPNNGDEHFGGIEEISLDDLLTTYMANKSTNKQRRTKKQASPAGNNLIEIDQGVGAPDPKRDTNTMWNETYTNQDNTAEGGDPSQKMGSSDKDAEVEQPYGHTTGEGSVMFEDDHKYNITTFAKIGKGEDPYIDGVMYSYDELLPQHKSDVDANWKSETPHKGRDFLWLRTSMKTADILSESEKWYRKNRNKKWKLEDRDRVLHLASLMMDGATITPLMVSPIGEPKGGCWEGYHRLAAADMLQIKTLPVIMKIDPHDAEWQKKVAQHERQPWVAVDLDGTILADSFSKPKGRPPLGEPLPGAREALQELVDAGIRVSIWTARQYFEEEEGDNAEWQTEIDEHMKYHKIPYTDIYVGKKPPADVFIDDKAVAFRGNWPAVLQEAVEKVQKEAISLEAVVEQEAIIDMESVMIGNDDDMKDQYVDGDESREALNMPFTWGGADC